MATASEKPLSQQRVENTRTLERFGEENFAAVFRITHDIFAPFKPKQRSFEDVIDIFQARIRQYAIEHWGQKLRSDVDGDKIVGVAKTVKNEKRFTFSTSEQHVSSAVITINNFSENALVVVEPHLHLKWNVKSLTVDDIRYPQGAFVVPPFAKFTEAIRHPFLAHQDVSKALMRMRRNRVIEFLDQSEKLLAHHVRNAATAIVFDALWIIDSQFKEPIRTIVDIDTIDELMGGESDKIAVIRDGLSDKSLDSMIPIWFVAGFVIAYKRLMAKASGSGESSTLFSVQSDKPSTFFVEVELICADYTAEYEEEAATLAELSSEPEVEPEES